MSTHHSIELLPIEARIVDVIHGQHLGKNHAATSKELQATFGFNGSTLRKYINNIRSRGIPICSCNNGYYYPEQVSDCANTVSYLSERLDAVMQSVSGVESGMDMMRAGLDPTDLIAVSLSPKPLP